LKREYAILFVKVRISKEREIFGTSGIERGQKVWMRYLTGFRLSGEFNWFPLKGGPLGDSSLKITYWVKTLGWG